MANLKIILLLLVTGNLLVLAALVYVSRKFHWFTAPEAKIAVRIAAIVIFGILLFFTAVSQEFPAEMFIYGRF